MIGRGGALSIVTAELEHQNVLLVLVHSFFLEATDEGVNKVHLSIVVRLSFIVAVIYLLLCI